jgi:D-arginine dehydrogenase
MPERADAIVIGAGIAGVSAAAALATSMRVVVVEQEHAPGQHASGRSAAVLSETSGHPLVCALARLSRPLLEDPPPEFTDHPLLTPRGLVWVGEAGDEAPLDELAERGVRVAPRVRRIDAERARTLLPTFSAPAIAAGGVWEPDAMTIDIGSLLQGYVRQLRGRGGTVHTSAEAIQVERIGATWRVTAASHAVDAPVVVDAAGAWGDVIAARAGVRPLGLTPYRRTAAIAPAPETVASWPLIMDIRGRYYCEPEAGGLLISPADETPSDPCDAQPEELDVALALERVRDACGIPLRAIRRAWAGLRTFAPDRAPVLGEDTDAPGFWWLVGQGGAGIKTAPAMADVLARLVRGDPLPAGAAALGVTAESLGPARLRL